ncbi:uncharacterized protein [Dysidea avara]|uniref:uncharacterized protein n=1 Tax=Dysidea avara TaxID=196820 RepID=UPI0033288859
MELSMLDYKGNFYEFFLVDDKTTEIINIASSVFDGQVFNIAALIVGVENEMLADIIFSLFFQPTFHHKVTPFAQCITTSSNDKLNVYNILFNSIFYDHFRVQTLKNNLKFASNDFMISYFDISFNIQHQSIKRIVIRCITSWSKNIDDLILTEYHKGNDTLTCIVSQTPLVVLNNLSSSSKSIQNCAAVFIVNRINISEYIGSLFEDLSDYNISKYTLYILNCNILQCDLDNALMTLMNHSNIDEIIMCNANLTDNEISKVIKLINAKRIMKNIRFILVSKSMLISNAKNSDFISALLQNNQSINTLKPSNYALTMLILKNIDNSRMWNTIDLSGCNIGNEGCRILCEEIFSKKKEIYINELNLTRNALTSSCITTLTKLLHYCVINKLICSYRRTVVSRNSTLTNEIICTDKKIRNFVHKIPLIVNETIYSSHTQHVVSESFKSQSGELICSSHISKFIADDENCIHAGGLIIKQEMDQVSVLFPRWKCANQRCEAAVRNKILDNDVIIEFIRIAKRYAESQTKVLCFSTCNTAEAVNNILFILHANKKHIVWNVVELQMTLLQFSKSYSTKMICEKGKIMITCDDFEHAVNIKRLSKLKLLNCYIGIKIVAIKTTDYSKSALKMNSWDILSQACLQKYNLSKSFCKLLCDKYPIHELFISNCLDLQTLKTVVSILKEDLGVSITLFEVGRSNATAVKFIHYLKSFKKKIRYIISSSTNLFAFSMEQDLLLKALQTTGDSLATIELSQCVLFTKDQCTIGPALCEKLMHCGSLTIDRCELTDKLCNLFCELLLSVQILPNCIKKLDISSNQVTSDSTSCIINAMKHTIIKILIVCDNKIHKKAIINSIINDYYSGKKILNLDLGIPLVIINKVGGKMVSSVLLGNCIIDNQVTFLRSIIVEYHITKCSFYCFQGIILFDKDTIFQSFNMHTENLAVYMIEPRLRDACVFKVCQKLGEHLKQKIAYICMTENRLYGNCLDHCLVKNILENLPIDQWQLIDCDNPLINDELTLILSNVYRQWKVIDFSGCGIRYNEIYVMLQSLKNNKSTITSLNLSHNKLQAGSAVLIAEIIIICKVSEINFCDNELTDIDLLDAITTVQVNSPEAHQPHKSTLFNTDSVTVVLYNLSITSTYHYDMQSAQKSLINIVMINCLLESECILFDNINHHSKLYFRNSLHQFQQMERTIKTLHCSTLCIEQESIKYGSLQSNCYITCVSYKEDQSRPKEYVKPIFRALPTLSGILSMCKRRYEFVFTGSADLNLVIKMLKGLLINGTLHILEIASCNITDDVARDMMILCNNYQSMCHLSMIKCELSTSVIKTVAKALRNTSSLKYIDVSYNTINDESAVEVASIINHNMSLEHLNLNSCNLRDTGIVKIFDALSKISTLISLDLGNNIVTNVSATKLGDVIDANSSLNKLNLPNCFRLNTSSIALKTFAFNQIGTLTYLNMSSNCISSSTSILASIVYYSKLEHLDLSNCHLKSSHLQQIVNRLVSINVLKYFNIESNVISDYVAQKLAFLFSKSTILQHLNMSNCCLSALHIEKFVKMHKFSTLQHLNISQNYLRGIRVAISIGHLLRDTKNTLKYLNISNCNLEDVAVQTIGDSLTDLTFLCHLDISKIKITRQAAERIAIALKCHYSLEHLNISNCFSGEDSLVLFNAFKAAKNLRYLNASLNPINDKVAICLAAAIRSNTKLEHLNVAQCGINETGFLAILKAFDSISTLRHLDIASNRVNEEVARQMANLGFCNKNLNYLNLANTEIKSVQLFNPLVSAKLNLHSLDLSSNTIDYQDSVAIAKAIKSSAIKYLNFSWTVLSALNGQAIMSALVSMTSLQHLNLESCVINNETATFLAIIIANCTCLSYLNLSKTKLQQEGVIVVATSLQQSYSIQTLILDSICIPNEAAKEISFAIQHHLPLIHLSLFECKVKEEGLLNIASALQSISTLEHLDLSCTIISNKAAAGIASALLKNSALKHLDFSECEFECGGEHMIRRILSSLTLLNYCNF